MNSPIRVLHLVPWIAAGGVERRRLTLARRLARKRFEQRLLCLEQLTPLGDEIRSAGVPVVELGGSWSYRDWFTSAMIRRWVTDWRPHIVHGAVYEGVVMASSSWLISREHKVIVEETDVPVNRRIGGHAILGLAASRADLCVGVSREVSRYFESKLRVPSRRVKTILNGVERPRAVGASETARIKAELGIPPGAKVVGTVGRLHDRHKRQSDLIEAFGRLRSQHKDVRLLIIGSGPDRSALESKASQLGLGTSVHFAGYQADTAPYYACLDVFALVSNREACPLVLMEAMLHGLPVVTTAIGGGSELVRHEVDGVHVPVGDIEAIARRVGELLWDENKSGALSRQAKTHAEANYTADRYVEQVAETYEHIVGASRAV
ncbi:MAG: glycosyltransferase [Myxococcota bacterium]